MELAEIRAKIDKIDDGLLELFLQRLDLCEEVVRYKKENALPILNRERERQVLARAKNNAGKQEEAVHQLFVKLMELSKARERELMSGGTKVRKVVENALLPAEVLFPKSGTVACQGTEGANSQAACDKLLPRGDIQYVKTFDAVFDAVSAGFCDYGVLPIENNSFGSVRTVYELLQKKQFTIVRSTSLNIRHALLSKLGTKLEDITTVYSHEQAIGQCHNFLAGLKDGVRVIPYPNTALAAKAVAENNDPNVAAIAAPACKELYDLEILKEDIQDSDNNYTKFILIAKEPAIYAGSNRISLVFTCPNQPGALAEILTMFSSHGINMLKLESCPIPGRDFEFQFYVELDASVREPGVLPILEELERICESFTFLGNYAVI